MINVLHLKKCLDLFFEINPNTGMNVSDILSFYNELARRQRANCAITANIFRHVFEMYLCARNANYTIETGSRSDQRVRGFGIRGGTPTEFLHSLKYSLMTEDNTQAIETNQQMYSVLSDRWDSQEKALNMRSSFSSTPTPTPVKPRETPTRPRSAAIQLPTDSTDDLEKKDDAKD